MDAKISDFALARQSLEILCYQYDLPFMDIPIEFGDFPTKCEDNKFYIKENGSLHKTIFSIVFLYMNNFMRDVDENELADALNFILAVLMAFKYQDPFLDFEALEDDEVIVMRLDQNPFIWILMRDIICPFYNLKLQNLRVIAGKSSVIDMAKCIREDDDDLPDVNADDFPILFMNLDINSFAVRTAALFVETLRAHTDNPEALIRDLFNNFFMKDKIISFVQMTFTDEEDEADFFAILSILCQSEDLEKLALEGHKKQAGTIKQAQYEGNLNNWWFMGLTEKMLDPARSEDWTIYETWKPITDELWSRVEEERRKRNLDEVPFDMLLDIQRDLREQHTDETKTLQSLLSDDRIW